jgi:hypothetical protein
MSEQVTAIVKSELIPDQKYSLRVDRMTNSQLATELRKQRRKMHGPALAFAILLDIVFRSTASSGLGGKLAAALRG